MKKQKGKIILIIVLLIIIIAVAIYFICKDKLNLNDNTKDNVNENQNGQTYYVPGENLVEEFAKYNDEGVKVNTSSKLSEEKEVNGFKITNIELTMENSKTTLKSKITNNTGKDSNYKMVDVVLLDKDQNEIITLGGMIGDVKNGESVEFICESTLDFTNVYDFKIVIK